MSKANERPALEDVLDTYLVAVEEPDLDSAREWGRRFPEHAEAIRDFVTSWRLAARLPANPSAAPIDTATFVQRGMTVVAGVLRGEQEKDLAAVTRPPIESLLVEAKARGISTADLAAKLGLSVTLLAKLNRRLLDHASIPRELIQAIAVTLARSADAVALYFAQPPTFAAGAFHRAAGKPAIADREDFFGAVRSDLALTDEHRARWLSLSPGGKPLP
ncbi:hypothetical protein [Sorangium sp. So ce693]|uniref:hypothetical protein n=1 Tax=Sorangium sp. So ce693 TaxID=3133318 RepID=UPI003F639B2E